MYAPVSDRGFTIVEVLIFLVVSAFILSSALVLMGGRQQQVQYQQGVRDFDGRIRTTINDVTNGFFPNQPFGCATASGAITFSSVGTDEQGTREDCLFAGKVIRPLSGSDTELEIISLAAERATIGEVSSVASAGLTPINDPARVDLTQTHETSWGLQLKRISNEAGDELSFVAIISSFGEDDAGSRFESGAGAPSVYVGVQGLHSLGTGTMDIPEPLQSNDAIYFCLEHDDVSQKAVVILGKDGRQLSTSVDQDAEGGYMIQCGF